MKRLLVAVCLVAVASLVLACGPSTSPVPSGSPAVSSPPGQAPSAPGGRPQLTPNPVETSAPKYGGTVRLETTALAGYDLHMKPAFAAIFLAPIYNTLLTFNLDYIDVTGENLVGDLATSWKVSPDGKSITFDLVKNARWHDGKPFTADDVVYSIKKMTDPKRSVVSGELTAYESVEKLGDSTIKINLKNPSPSFLLNLAGPYAVMQPQHLSSADPKTPEFAVGTGPFVFKSLKKDAEFHLGRSPAYFKKDKLGNQLPYLDGVSVFSMSGGWLNAFLAKRLDMTSPAGAIQQADSIKQIKEQAPEVIMNKTQPGWGSVPYVYWFNLSNKYLKDARIRRAITLLMDPTEHAIARAGSLEFADLSRAIFPAAWGLPSDEISKVMMWDQPFEKRVAEAQRLMKEAGYDGGLKVRICYRGVAATAGTGISVSCTVLADQLRRYLNVDSQIQGLQTAEWANVKQTGAWEIINDNIMNLLSDPDSHMAYFKTADPANVSGYSNPDVDKLWEQQSREMDPAKRRQVLLDIERKLLTDLPCMPGFFALGYRCYYPWLKNMRYSTSVYGPAIRYETLWVDNK